MMINGMKVRRLNGLPVLVNSKTKKTKLVKTTVNRMVPRPLRNIMLDKSELTSCNTKTKQNAEQASIMHKVDFILTGPVATKEENAAKLKNMRLAIIPTSISVNILNL
jgi:hypothetical protein